MTNWYARTLGIDAPVVNTDPAPKSQGIYRMRKERKEARLLQQERRRAIPSAFEQTKPEPEPEVDLKVEPVSRGPRTERSAKALELRQIMEDYCLTPENVATITNRGHSIVKYWLIGNGRQDIPDGVFALLKRSIGYE